MASRPPTDMMNSRLVKLGSSETSQQKGAPSSSAIDDDGGGGGDDNDDVVIVFAHCGLKEVISGNFAVVVQVEGAAQIQAAGGQNHTSAGAIP